jgi:heptosyltransferase-2/heptosyltransferase-3
VYEQRLSLLRELGWLGSNPGWAWQIPSDDHSWATSQISASTIHFSISAASSPLNEWPLDFWAETLRQVWKKSPQTKFLSTGSGSEREIARQADLVSLVQDERLQIFFNPMPISRLAALLERATLHVGLDSGVLHLAMALGKPTVSLFRESVGRPGWVPRGSKHRALIKKCPCNESGQKKCFESRPLCLSLITPQEVAQAVLAALDKKL